MWLHIFDSDAARVSADYSEMATAALGKPDVKSYFHYSLQQDEVLTTDIVYIVSDDILNNTDLYYVLEINNTGVVPQKKDDIALMKILMGWKNDNFT